MKLTQVKLNTKLDQRIAKLVRDNNSNKQHVITKLLEEALNKKNGLDLASVKFRPAKKRGPKTEEGLARVREAVSKAQTERWQRQKEQQQQEESVA